MGSGPSLRSAGVHWPNGPEDYERIRALPSPLLVMLASEARWHYDRARADGKIVVWRGLPRQGKRPAEIGWSRLGKNADEATNLWGEAEHSGEEWFVPYNELDLQYERGDDDPDFERLPERYHLLTSFLYGILPKLRERLTPDTKILFPPFTPDHGDRDHVGLWEEAAKIYDGLVIHAYGDPVAARERIVWYLERFPDRPIVIGEWNSPDPRAFLAMLLDLEGQYPNLIGAAYFCWHWYDAPDSWPASYDVDANDDLYRLLLEPPIPVPIPDPITTPIPEAPPMNRQEKVDLIRRVAREYGLVEAEFLGGAFAESGPNLDQWERYGTWPDVSFGLFHQTVKFAPEGDGDHTASPENIAYVRGLYFDPEHAARVAAAQYKYWRYNPDVPALQAWCGYNWPGSYEDPSINPNIGNYRQGLQRAADELGQAIPDRTWGEPSPYGVIHQQNSWECAVRSLYANLYEMARQGLIAPVTYGDGGPRDVFRLMVPTYDSEAQGLKLASGAGVVEALRSWGITATNRTNVTLSEAQAVAGTMGAMIGGAAWNHWVRLRGVEGDGTLILDNPSPGYQGISGEVRDSWGRLGPMSMVTIPIPSAPPPPPPPPPPAPHDNPCTCKPHEPAYLAGYNFGFKAKAQDLGEAVVGTALGPEQGLGDRFTTQVTSGGIMVFSKATGEVAFIKG